MIAHNEHWLAGDLGNVAVVIDLPEDGRVPVVSPTVVCCLPAVGLNAHGAGQGIGSLTASDDGVGVPRVLVSRSSLEARSRADAVARAAMPGRAGGYGHVYAFPDDAFTVETTGRRHRVLDGDGPHTNHYLDAGLAAIAPPPPEGSRARLTRLKSLLEERHPSSPEDLMEVDARSRLRTAGDLPASRAGGGRRGLRGDVLDGGRRGRETDVGDRRQPLRVGVQPSTTWPTCATDRRETDRAMAWTTPLLYERLTWPEVRRAAGEDRVCLIPAGTLEDHGPHLPLDTDTRIASDSAGRRPP